MVSKLDSSYENLDTHLPISLQMLIGTDLLVFQEISE